MKWIFALLPFFATLESSHWFTESLYNDWGQTFEMEEILYDADADEQRIIIFENGFFGRVLALDGVIQTTERDEFTYHEMMTHVPLLAHGSVKKVLVIGGGDGGSIREVLRHRGVEEVTLVDIDRSVINMCKKHLPSLSDGAFDDERLEVAIADGCQFVKKTEDKYDVIIIDSTDPIGPGSVLFTREFYGDCHEILAEGGILITQSGVPFMQDEEFIDAYYDRKSHFKDVGYYLVVVPTYVGGFMTLGWATDDPSIRDIAVEELHKRLEGIDGEMRYYTPELHKAAFCLPKFMDDLVGN